MIKLYIEMKKDNESRILNQIFKFNDLTDNLMLKKS